MDRGQQILNSFLQKPLAPTHLFSTLEAELSSLNSIHTSYNPLILAAIQCLKKEPSFNGVLVSNKHMRRSLLPFLGDALSWLTGTATTKDINSIKTRNNQFLATQHNQHETLVHVISILNVTRHATQVNRQHINIVMSAAEKMHKDVTTLYKIMHSLYSSLSYQQIVLHICSILANLPNCVLPIEDIQEMLIHIEETLLLNMHLPMSSEDALHFYRFLCTHILIADEQFLLLINVPIQDHTQQLEIYEVFNWLYLTETSQFKPKGQQTVLQFEHTPSTTHQPTNLYITFIHQGQS